MNTTLTVALAVCSCCGDLAARDAAFVTHAQALCVDAHAESRSGNQAYDSHLTVATRRGGGHSEASDSLPRYYQVIRENGRHYLKRYYRKTKRPPSGTLADPPPPAARAQTLLS